MIEDIDATIDLQEKLSSRVADPSNESHEEGSKVSSVIIFTLLFTFSNLV